MGEKEKRTHLAGVATCLASCAKISLVETKGGTQTRVLEGRLALVVGQHWKLHLLQDALELAVAPEGVLTPTGGLTPVSHEGAVGVRETHGRDVGAVGGWEGGRVSHVALKTNYLNSFECKTKRTREEASG